MSAGNVEEVSRTTMSEKIVETIGDIVISVVETTAQFSLGQTFLRATDRLLWVVEKSAQWSLPVQEVTAEENGKAFGKIELVRPLPWIFFLPSLVILRTLKLGINFGAFILGYQQLEAIGIVKIIQKGRRKLRSIKSNGLKTIRCRKGSRNREEELNEAKKSLINSMLSTLSALSCIETSRRTPSPPPTRVYVNRGAQEAQTATPEEESTTESTSPHVDGKRKYSQVEALDDSSDQSEDESVRAKLERLAAEDSDTEDQDFDPAKEELAMVSGVSSTGSSAEEDGDDDDQLSDTEIEDLRQACLITAEQISATLARVDEIIVEEPEIEPEFEASSTPKEKSFENSIGDVPVVVADDDEDKGKSLNVDDKSLSENLKSTPETTSSKNYEDINEKVSNFYSPIDSPTGGSDSVSDFKTPKENDKKETENQFTQQTDEKTILETSDKDESLKDIKETQLDKVDKKKESSTVSPKIRKDDATSNKNGLTADEKERSKLVPTGVKTQDKDKQPKLSESKKK